MKTKAQAQTAVLFDELPDMTLEEKLQEYAALDTELGLLIGRHAKLKKAIKDEVKDTGVIASGVTIGKPYTRYSWDGKGLVDYAKKYPDIIQFQKQIEVRTIRINVGDVSFDDGEKK